MAGMGQHSADAVHEAAGRPLRRARKWAHLVFWLTAGSSVLYNSYHALVSDRMPWYTGVPEGFVPLLVAIGVLEFSVAWRDNKWLQGSSWLVTGGAMAWSAVQVGSVVRNGWAFGLIADSAALAAMYFLLNGPTAQQAVTSVARAIAELTGQRDAERNARERAEADGRAAVSDLKARAGAELAKRDAAHREELEAERNARETAEAALASARSQAEAEAARAERLARKLAGPAGRSAGGAGNRGTAPRTGTAPASGTAPADDLDLEAQALKLLATNLDMSGAELARNLGVTEGYGRKLRRKLTQPDRLAETGPLPQDRPGTAPVERGEDRA